MYILTSLIRLSRSWRRQRTSRFQPEQGRTDLPTIVRRERARADRTKGKFSLLVFSVAPECQREGPALLAAAEHLVERTRITDLNGWISPGRFWLLLSECPKHFALTIADDACDRFSTAKQTILCDAFFYSANAEEQDRPADQLPPDAQLVDQEAPAPGSASLAAQPGDGRCWSQMTLEDLFARRTPGWKRALDLALAAPSLLLLAPLLLVIGILIRITSVGPALFIQWRTGAAGKPFRMYKFRTMSADAERQHARLLAMNEQDGPAFKMRHDPRVTPLGHFLRKSCLDELPQLWNVLLGNMSLVGPRPLPIAEMDKCQPWQRERLDVAPGMTCFWQVRGDRLQIAFEDWMRMDIAYARRRHLLLDLRIAVKTLAFVFGRRGT